MITAVSRYTVATTTTTTVIVADIDKRFTMLPECIGSNTTTIVVLKHTATDCSNRQSFVVGITRSITVSSNYLSCSYHCFCRDAYLSYFLGQTKFYLHCCLSSINPSSL